MTNPLNEGNFENVLNESIHSDFKNAVTAMQKDAGSKGLTDKDVRAAVKAARKIKGTARNSGR